MSMPVKYSRRRMLRLSEQSDEKLVIQAKSETKKPAELARELVDEGLERRATQQ